MQILQNFIKLISKTEGRDQFLRLIQFGCLHAKDHKQKGARIKIYLQMRMTRKLIRFLKTISLLDKLKQDFINMQNNSGKLLVFLRCIVGLCRGISRLYYFLSDHKICLKQLGVLNGQITFEENKKCYKYYFLENILGVLYNMVCIGIEISTNATNCKDQAGIKKLVRNIKYYAFDLIKCVFDSLVAKHYENGGISAKITGFIGVLSSIMAIMQSLQ